MGVGCRGFFLDDEGSTFLAVPIVQDLETLPILDRQEGDVADALLNCADDLRHK